MSWIQFHLWSITYLLIFALCSSVFLMWTLENRFWKIACLIAFVLLVFELPNRTNYLPFLGECAMTTGLDYLSRAPSKTPYRHIVRNLPPYSKVIYWATVYPVSATTPNQAYGDYSNSLWTTANDQGEAVLYLKNAPVSYHVLNGMVRLDPHIHYRYSLSNGLWSAVSSEKFFI